MGGCGGHDHGEHGHDHGAGDHSSSGAATAEQATAEQAAAEQAAAEQAAAEQAAAEQAAAEQAAAEQAAAEQAAAEQAAAEQAAAEQAAADQVADEHEGHDHEGHDHDPVHPGGVLAELGDHMAQLEAALDSEKGTITLWVWDAHIENTIRLKDASLLAAVSVGEDPFRFSFAAQAKVLTGETVGNSSEFKGQDARLVGAKHVDVLVPSITVKGITYTDLKFHLH